MDKRQRSPPNAAPPLGTHPGAGRRIRRLCHPGRAGLPPAAPLVRGLPDGEAALDRLPDLSGTPDGRGRRPGCDLTR